MHINNEVSDQVLVMAPFVLFFWQGNDLKTKTTTRNDAARQLNFFFWKERLKKGLSDFARIGTTNMSYAGEGISIFNPALPNDCQHEGNHNTFRSDTTHHPSCVTFGWTIRVTGWCLSNIELQSTSLATSIRMQLFRNGIATVRFEKIFRAVLKATAATANWNISKSLPIMKHFLNCCRSPTGQIWSFIMWNLAPGSRGNLHWKWATKLPFWLRTGVSFSSQKISANIGTWENVNRPDRVLFFPHCYPIQYQMTMWHHAETSRRSTGCGLISALSARKGPFSRAVGNSSTMPNPLLLCKSKQRDKARTMLYVHCMSGLLVAMLSTRPALRLSLQGSGRRRPEKNNRFSWGTYEITSNIPQTTILNFFIKSQNSVPNFDVLEQTVRPLKQTCVCSYLRGQWTYDPKFGKQECYA